MFKIVWVGGWGDVDVGGGGGGGGALSLLLNPSMILALSSRLTYSYRQQVYGSLV